MSQEERGRPVRDGCQLSRRGLGLARTTMREMRKRSVLKFCSFEGSVQRTWRRIGCLVWETEHIREIGKAFRARTWRDEPAFG